MTTTYEHYRLIKEVEDNAKRLGFRIVPSKYGADRVALMPADDNLPIYSRDTEMVSGTFDYISAVLRGWEISTMYYTMLCVISPAILREAEDEVRVDRLATVLATGNDPRSDK